MLEALIETLQPVAYVVHATFTAAVLYFNAALWFRHRRNQADRATGEACGAVEGSPTGIGAEASSEHGRSSLPAREPSACSRPIDAFLWIVAAVASIAPIIAIATIDELGSAISGAFSPYSDALVTGHVATLLLCHPLAIMLHAIGVILLAPRDGSRWNLAGTSLLALVACVAGSVANLSLLP